jgi:hypothetical protein
MYFIFSPSLPLSLILYVARFLFICFVLLGLFYFTDKDTEAQRSEAIALRLHSQSDLVRLQLCPPLEPSLLTWGKGLALQGPCTLGTDLY